MPALDILPRFAAVLLDMNGTFMFGEDRFGPDQDCAATYRTLGGERVTPALLRETITACCESLETIYNDPTAGDSFPQVLELLRALPAARDLPDEELTLLQKRCDVGGAGRAGLATVWIDRDGVGLLPGGPQPDWIVRDLRELIVT